MGDDPDFDPTVPPLALELLSAMEDPNYVVDQDKVMALVDNEFPSVNFTPTVYDLDDSVLRMPDNGLMFQDGQWVERLGNDMVWHLEPIVRTVRVARQDGNGFELDYKTSAGLLVQADRVRAPEEALKRHFGCRPWVWQQWANLRLESHIRFQKHHEFDIMEVSCQQIGMELWTYFLEEPRNAEFKKLYDSKPSGAQQKLVHHLMQPFRLEDEIKSEWDFETAHVSVYQYSAFLGSGYLASFTVFLLQMIIPFLILYYQVRISKQFPAYQSSHLYSYDLAEVFGTTWYNICTYDVVTIDKMVINIIVFVIYVIRVLPSVFIIFYETTGDMDSISSKLNSIRIISWLQGDDTPPMQFGFRLNLYMNSFYVAVMNVLMLAVLFLTDSTVDVILNALALEFVFYFDKEVASYPWYDDHFRFLKASVVEIIICGELHLEWIRSDKEFCKQYDVPEDLFYARVDGPLSDKSQARIDTANKKWCLTARERLWLSLARVAPQSGRQSAVAQFVEPKVGFGYVDILTHALGIEIPSMFMRYSDLYTWSRWDQALWLAVVPPIGQPCAFEGLACNHGGVLGFDDEACSNERKNMPSFINFDPSSSLDPIYRFIWQVVNTILGSQMVHNFKMTTRRKFYIQVPIRILDCAFEIFAYLFICFFPVTMFAYAVLIFGCFTVQ